MTIDKVTAYSSGEEDELWFIPIVLNDPASMAPIQRTSLATSLQGGRPDLDSIFSFHSHSPLQNTMLDQCCPTPISQHPIPISQHPIPMLRHLMPIPMLRHLMPMPMLYHQL